MRKIILIDWFGNWHKVRINKKHIVDAYFIENTINGIPKYTSNIRMFFASLFTQGHEDKPSSNTKYD